MVILCQATFCAILVAFAVHLPIAPDRGRLRKREIMHAKPVAAVAMA